MPEPRPYAAVVFHPEKTDVNALADAIEARETAAGYASTLWYETAPEDSGKAAAERALANGADVVLVSGGDGTVRAVAEVLRGTGTPLAIIPQGTGNLMARNLGMPLTDLEAQVRAAFSGVEKAVDLGVADITREDGSVESHVYLVLAGMGLDARLISTTSSKLKKSFGWLAYVDAGIRTAIADSPLKVHVSYNGDPEKTLRVYTLMAGNCGLLPGGLLLIPNAKMDDGLIDMVALRPKRRLGPFSWLRILNEIGWENGVLRKTRVGRHIIDLTKDARAVTYKQLRTLDVRVDEPEVIQLDGDDFGKTTLVRSRVDAGALSIRVLESWKPAA